MELTDIKGIGSTRLKALNDAGIYTAFDILKLFPYKYYDFSDVGKYKYDLETPTLLQAKAIEEPKNVYFKGLNYCIAKFLDLNTNIKFNAVWYNQPYIKNVLKVDENYFIYGKTNNKKQFVVQFFSAENKVKSTIFPVYKSLNGIGQVMLKNIISEVLYNQTINSELDNIINLNDKSDIYFSLKEAYFNVHFPKDIQQLEKSKERISLEDMVALIAAEEEVVASNKVYKDFEYSSGIDLSDYKKNLPFALTNCQQNALKEIANDMQSKNPMNRLLLGDVGSGKTAVALGACYYAYKNNHQSLIMAPTEILATQHYLSAKNIFKNLNLEVALLTSSTTTNERKNILKRLVDKEIDILIGTHSLISEKVEFADLTLAITDEQHRFGVQERAMVGNKGNREIDQLIMSATPIPRSFYLMLFGGLKTSELNERPAGSPKISTHILSQGKEMEMWKYLANELKENTKCFVVVPRVEESESDNKLNSTESVLKVIQKYISPEKISVIHGKMDKKKQRIVMDEFKNGSKNILIATTVIEVGIDVPSADTIVIYDADRFGLATLHQLRGRVGRNGKEAHCYLVTNATNENSVKRLQVLKNNLNGIKIAEEDLKLRGSGTIYGTKQHGVGEVFSNFTFTTELYNQAKSLYNLLENDIKNHYKEIAKAKFKEIFKKIVLN